MPALCNDWGSRDCRSVCYMKSIRSNGVAELKPRASRRVVVELLKNNVEALDIPDGGWLDLARDMPYGGTKGVAWGEPFDGQVVD